MEPATYEIPLVVLPQRQHPWQRLYMSATHSSAAHAHAVPHTYANGNSDEEVVRDSLEWILKSNYDHQYDLFVDKSSHLRRPGIDQRRCQREQKKVIVRRDTSRVLREELEAEALANGRDGMSHIKTWRETSKSPSETSSTSSGYKRSNGGPKVVTMRTRDSLATSLLYTPRPTHELTVPKVTPGYARNPTGSFFTS